MRRNNFFLFSTNQLGAALLKRRSVFCILAFLEQPFFNEMNRVSGDDFVVTKEPVSIFTLVAVKEPHPNQFGGLHHKRVSGALPAMPPGGTLREGAEQRDVYPLSDNWSLVTVH